MAALERGLAGIERAEEVASGSDGRKGGMLDFEGERLDPYETLDVPKDANLVQLKAAFRKLVLKWHPDKHEGEGDAAIAYAVRQFKRVRIAYSVLSDPNERARLDEEGVLTVSGGGALITEVHRSSAMLQVPRTILSSVRISSPRGKMRDAALCSGDAAHCMGWAARLSLREASHHYSKLLFTSVAESTSRIQEFEAE